MINYLYDQADDKKNLFQRGHILNHIFKRYPKLNLNHSFLYNIFDNNYNDALALSVNAQRISNMQHTLNGIALSNFLYHFDYQIYKKICSLTPYQIFILSGNISWLQFVQNIKDLYEHLFIKKNIQTNYNIYKYYNQRMFVKKYIFNSTIDIIEDIIGQIDISKFNLCDYIYFKKALNDYIENLEIYLKSKDYIYYIASDIYDRKKSIQTIINDIETALP